MSYLFLVVVLGLVGWAQTQNSPNVTNICTGHLNNTLIRDVFDCEKYFACIDGVPEPRECFFGAQFDPVVRECTYRSFECFKCPEEPYFIDLPLDYECLQFIRCFAGIGVQLTCSDGLLFDPVREQCNLSADVVCACPVNDLPGHPLFVRSWTNCSNYHVCAKGDTIVQSCAEGLNFNLVTRQCDLPVNVDCNSTSTNWIFNEISRV